MAKRPHVCRCPRCRGVKTADRRYGFDLALVPGMYCLHCDKLIGRRRWVAVPILAGFSTLFFAHRTCSQKANA